MASVHRSFLALGLVASMARASCVEGQCDGDSSDVGHLSFIQVDLTMVRSRSASHEEPTGEETGAPIPAASDDIEDGDESADHVSDTDSVGLVKVDCGHGVAAMVPEAEADDARKICDATFTNASNKTTLQQLKSERSNASSVCPIHRANTYCKPRYDVPNLVTLDFCRIFTQSSFFWGNSCSKYYFWRETSTEDGNSYGPCRCCHYNTEGKFHWYTSGVGNNVYSCGR